MKKEEMVVLEKLWKLAMKEGEREWGEDRRLIEFVQQWLGSLLDDGGSLYDELIGKE